MAEPPTNPSHEEGQDENFQESIQQQNELIKLKLSAQFGARFGYDENIPPEVENNFLKTIMGFEQGFREYKPVTVRHYLGNPVFKKSHDLEDDELNDEWERLDKLLEEKEIAIAFMRSRDDRFKYRFITEELFEHQMDYCPPGMTTQFIYEEFHPDHELDIYDQAHEFTSEFCAMTLSESSMTLGDNFVLPNGQLLAKDEMLKKFQIHFEAWSAIINHKFLIDEVKFQWDEVKGSGLGHAEGKARYNAVLENGESIHHEGPFKLYFSNQDGWWTIFYFVLPGFKW